MNTRKDLFFGWKYLNVEWREEYRHPTQYQVSARLGPFIAWIEFSWWRGARTLGRSIGGHLTLWFKTIHLSIAGKCLTETQYPASDAAEKMMQRKP